MCGFPNLEELSPGRISRHWQLRMSFWNTVSWGILEVSSFSINPNILDAAHVAEGLANASENAKLTVTKAVGKNNNNKKTVIYNINLSN